MTTAETTTRTESPVAGAVRLVPGIVLLAVIGIVGVALQAGVRGIAGATGTRLPDIEYVLWAIVLGLIVRNTVGVPGSSGPASGPTSSGSRSGSSCSAHATCSATCSSWAR